MALLQRSPGRTPGIDPSGAGGIAWGHVALQRSPGRTPGIDPGTEVQEHAQELASTEPRENPGNRLRLPEHCEVSRARLQRSPGRTPGIDTLERESARDRSDALQRSPGRTPGIDAAQPGHDAARGAASTEPRENPGNRPPA